MHADKTTMPMLSHVEAVRLAATRPEVVQAVDDLYRELDAEIATQGATCWNKGECCRFGEYGHRLFVTTLEVAYYLARTTDGPPPEESASAPRRLPLFEPADPESSEACPHARDGKCHARTARPMGCRIFYCDRNAQEWQGPMTERYLARLRELHEQFSVPYFYADWMDILRALRVCAPVRQSD